MAVERKGQVIKRKQMKIEYIQLWWRTHYHAPASYDSVTRKASSLKNY
jgi:hypothetical protein